MKKLSENEFESMTVSGKIARMDEMLGRAWHGSILRREASYLPTLKSIEDTKIFQNHTDQTKLAWLCFEFLLQEEYLNSYVTFSMTENQLYQGQKWSVTRHIHHNAILQAVITASRIQFEYFMNFIYFSLEGKELGVDSSGSKYNKFKEWVLSKGCMDDLFYLVPFLVACREHDDWFRTAEVHKGSKLKKSLFMFEEPKNFYNGDITRLNRFLRGCLTGIISILNNQRPTTLQWAFSSKEQEFDVDSWGDAYMEKDETKLNEFMELFKKRL